MRKRNMKNGIRVVLAVVIALSFGVRRSSGSIEDMGRIRMAVLDFQGINLQHAEASFFTEVLKGELSNSNRFILVEREYLTTILDEINIQSAGLTTVEQLVDVGKMVNIHKLLVGSIAKLDKYHISLRMIDIETGENEIAIKECTDTEEELLRKAKKLANDILFHYYKPQQKNKDNNSASKRKKMNVAVMNMNIANLNTDEMDSHIITEALKNEFIKQDLFTLVERDFLANILDEQKIQNLGIGSSRDIVKLGKLLNVNKLIVGSIGELNGKYYMNLRIIDVSSGTTEAAVQGKTMDKNEMIVMAEQLTRKLILSYYGVLF